MSTATAPGPHCPFCRGAISLDLAQYGGNCPHCMLEIPGDEAPTDPGAVLRQKQAEEQQVADAVDSRRRRRRTGLMVVLLVVLAGVSAWQLNAWQAKYRYAPVEYFEFPLEDIAAAPALPAEPAPEPVAAKSTGSKPGPRKGSSTTSKGETSVTPVGSGGGSGMTDAAPVGLTTSTGSVSLGAGGAVSIVRTDEVLTDEAQILDMIKRVVYGSSPQLEACYQQRLKQAPDLAGVWEVSFVVTKAGSTASVSVKARDRSDGELEACLRNTVSGWRFLKISADKPISRPYRFGAS